MSSSITEPTSVVNETPNSFGRVGNTISALVVAALAIIAAIPFSYQQTIWVDETTQLSGLQLGPVEIVRWLTNPASHDLGVPGDRMPPLSYWVGQGWAAGFGLEEIWLRWLGVVCVGIAAGLVYISASRAFGWKAGWAAGLLFAFSPNLCGIAVELRAYPLFVLTSAGALNSFVTILTRPTDKRRGSWWALTIWLVLASYTHFFGLVLAGSMLVTLFVSRYLEKEKVWPVLVSMGLVCGFAVGIVPFVLGAKTLSSGGELADSRNRMLEVIQLLYRLIGHPVLAAPPSFAFFIPIVGLALASAAIMLAAGGFVRAGSRRIWLALVATLGLGLGISITANFLLNGFTAAKTSYSAWALPLLYVALTGGLAAGLRQIRWVATAALLLLLACEMLGMTQLWQHGETFAHGPHRRLQALIDASSLQTAVVHDGTSQVWAALYFPLRYTYGEGLQEFVTYSGGAIQKPGTPLNLDDPSWTKCLLPYQRLIVVRARAQLTQDLAAHLQERDPPLLPGPIAKALEADPHTWRLVKQERFVAFVAADVWVFERLKSLNE